MSQHDDTTRIETLLDESDESTRRPSEATDQNSAEHTVDHPDDRADENPGDQPGERTADRPDPATSWAPAAPSPSAAPSPESSPYQAQDYQAQDYQGQAAVPEFKSGPAPTTSVVGLLGLLTVIAVLVAQATDLDVAWNVVGPVAVVGAGVLLVVLGLAGLRGQRFRGR